MPTTIAVLLFLILLALLMGGRRLGKVLLVLTFVAVTCVGAIWLLFGHA